MNITQWVNEHSHFIDL